jgi:putative ABC transport system permease protein
MNIFKISVKNLLNKRLTNGLSILLMALGVGIISIILALSTQLNDQFNNNIKGIDMVIGAKGSPLQLILSSIYQIDAPTGNINFSEAKAISKNPFIKKAIPISIGDSYAGYRIIGTDSSYLQHYKTEFEIGKIFEKPLQCVIGAILAAKLNLKIGDKLKTVHGLDDEGDKHDDHGYVITGILKPNNSVLDQLIITPLESVWEMHKEANNKKSALEILEEPSEQKQKNDSDSREITALLVKFRNPMGLMTIPRNINANTNMQAALPAIEINRLLSLMGIGIETFKWISFLIIFVSAISVFVSLYNSLKERKYELALMLSIGASRFKLFKLLLFEGLFIGILGYLLGFIFYKIGLFLMSSLSEQNFHYQFNISNFQNYDFYIMLACIGISVVAAAVPSFRIYKINISETLSEQ